MVWIFFNHGNCAWASLAKGIKMKYFGCAEGNLQLAQARPVRLSDTDLVLSFPRGKNSFTLLSVQNKRENLQL